MKKYIILFYLLILFVDLKAQTSKYKDCDLNAFTSPISIKAVNVYNEINGQIIMRLYADSIEGAGHIVSIIASKDGWLRIKSDCFSVGSFAWIKGGNLGLSTRNYNNEPISLYEEPNKNSKVINELFEQQIVLIFEADGQWAYIKGKGENGIDIIGWLEPEMQCPNPYTTCP